MLANDQVKYEAYLLNVYENCLLYKKTEVSVLCPMWLDKGLLKITDTGAVWESKKIHARIVHLPGKRAQVTTLGEFRNARS